MYDHSHSLRILTGLEDDLVYYVYAFLQTEVAMSWRCNSTICQILYGSCSNNMWCSLLHDVCTHTNKCMQCTCVCACVCVRTRSVNNCMYAAWFISRGIRYFPPVFRPYYRNWRFGSHHAFSNIFLVYTYTDKKIFQ